MEKQNKPLGMVVGKMMNEMFRVMKKRAGDHMEEVLTIEQFGLLYFIKKEEHEVIQREIAEIMGKDKSSILRMTDVLGKKELVRRVVDTNDRRKNKILVTKKGNRVIDQWVKIATELNAELMNDVNQADLDTFYRVVDRIHTKAKQL